MTDKYGPDAIGKDMRGRHGAHATGQANARYRGGRMRTSHGYEAVAVEEGHHLRQAHGYAFVHRLVAEAKLGRRLRSGEVVHHRNGNRADNRPENLEVLSKGDHARIHTDHPKARDARGRFTAERRSEGPGLVGGAE